MPFLKKKYSNIRGMAPFLLGVVCALIFGWYLFPKLMLKEHKQPVLFSHEIHLQNGIGCDACHYLRPDGSFSGIPTTQECAVCHKTVLGKSIEESEYIENYIVKNKKVSWVKYQKQPDNVFFSHAAHSLQACNSCHEYSEEELCVKCHIDMTQTEYPPSIGVNRLTGYTPNTMKMWSCEECHANPNHLSKTSANNACFVCHK